ncbi:small subunit of terminase [Enterococcus pseudoavium]|nr:small subunit of terminase [Enterococcus pseudoavium]
MARKRDPRRDEAFQIFKNADGSITNKEIAELLSVPEKTISAWKSRDKWIVVLQTDECSTTNKKGAPIGNKNAVGASGNSRASPPKGNKNALKTGEFETIYFDLLSDDEKAIYSADFSLVDRLNQDIQELTMRKYRMMKRVNEAEKGLNLVESEKLYELRGRKQYVDSDKGGKKISIEVPQVTMTEMKEKEIRKIEDILRIEDALTRISNQLTRTIKQLEEITLNEKRLQVFEAQRDKLKAETEELRGSNKGNEDANNWSELVAEAEKELGDHDG